MHHMRITLHDHLVREFDTADFRHPSGIVSSQIDEHQMLRQLLWVGQQFGFQIYILLFRVATATGTRNRSHGHFAIFQAHQDLWR